MNRSDINEYDMVRALYEYSRVGDYNIHIRVSALLQRTPHDRQPHVLCGEGPLEEL